MSRSNWKPSFIDKNFFTSTQTQSNSSDIVLFNRASCLTEEMVGMKIHIYNGIRFFTLTVESEMVGHRVGEFSPTRKKPVVKKKKEKKKK
jgi:small subunit ribosomal protein S19